MFIAIDDTWQQSNIRVRGPGGAAVALTKLGKEILTPPGRCRRPWISAEAEETDVIFDMDLKQLFQVGRREGII